LAHHLAEHPLGSLADGADAQIALDDQERGSSAREQTWRAPEQHAESACVAHSLRRVIRDRPTVRAEMN
jgi:hypothetical protein